VLGNVRPAEEDAKEVFFSHDEMKGFSLCYATRNIVDYTCEEADSSAEWFSNSEWLPWKHFIASWYGLSFSFDELSSIQKVSLFSIRLKVSIL
jgi:hypothetical protein